MTLVSQLECASLRDDVQPMDGARLVRLLVQFNRRIRGVKKSASPGPAGVLPGRSGT